MITKQDWIKHIIEYWYFKDPENKYLEAYIRIMLDREEQHLLDILSVKQ
jgi:hypothetical protein